MLGAKLQQAVALHQRGQLDHARRLYEEILIDDPRNADAWHLLGVIAAVSGELEQAVASIGKAIAINPNEAVIYNNRGAALLELARPDAALEDLDRALALSPGYADAHYNRANVLRSLGQWEPALAGYDRALSLKADHPETWSNRGIVLAALNRWDAAMSSYDRAIALRPDFAAAHFNRANVLCERRHWDAALGGYDRAIALKGDYAEAHCNRGFALHALERLEDALQSCDRAIAITADYPEAWCNRGTVLLAMRRLPEALGSYDRALALKPAFASGYANRALALLMAGEYERGWTDYEWRWKDPSNWSIKEKKSHHQPLWLGQQDLWDRTILLQSEQGYGDTIQFCRYVRLIAGLGARVILEVPAVLSTLLSSLEGVAHVAVHGANLPPFDYHCPFLSLPLAMKTSLSNVPAEVPYLSVDQERLSHWSAKLGEGHNLRVGLVWSGGFRPSQPELWSVNRRRNVPLESFAGFEHQAIEFYSLQKGEFAESELAEAMARGWGGPHIKDFTGELHDFADTAALIAQLDLVISVDTATAHLAGALGKPVWILNRFDACWRWLLDRDDSPWYPTARLYRQERPGDWEGVLQRVRRDLWRWAEAQGHGISSVLTSELKQ